MQSLGPLRGRLATARGHVGRAATLAAATGLLTSAATDAPLPLLATLAGSGTACAWGVLWSATLPKGRVRDTATALYLAPPAGALALLATERVVAGVHWWEFALDAAWGVAVWKLRPARTARVLAGRERSLTPEAVQQAVEQHAAAAPVPAGGHPLSLWWAQRAAVEGGVAPGTVLTDVQRTGQESMTALIRAAVPGTPVPTISLTALSALMDRDEDDITVAKVPGRGAGVRRLSVGAPDEAALDPCTRWARDIAPKGMPGTVITAIRVIDTDTGTAVGKELN